MSRLMELYLKKYGSAPASEKKASAEPDAAKLLSEILGTDEGSEKQAEMQKIAAVYEELGRRLARETFAAEQLGMTEPEKTAEAPKTEKAAAEDPLKDLAALLEPEKAEKTAEDGFEKFLSALADGEEKTAEQVEAEKYEAIGQKLAAGFLAGKKELAMKYLKRLGGIIRGGSTAAAGKARSVAKGFYGGIKETGQVARAFPGQAAALAGLGAGAGAGAGYMAGKKK